MTITVVIPTYKRPEDLRRCVQSMESQTRPADCILIVVAIEDALSRAVATESRERGFPVITLDSPIGGTRTALNLAFDHCVTDIIAIIDDDAAAYPEWLSRMEKHFEQDSTVGAVGGRDELQYADRPDLTNPPPTDCIGHLTILGQLQGNHHHPSISDLLETDSLKGVNMALRRKALGDIRIDAALRGNFTQIGWEIVLSFQLRSRGWKILFDRQLNVRHWVAARPPGESRTALTQKSAADSVYSTIYAVTSYAPLWRSLLFAGREIAVGSRFQPGILGLLYLMATGDFEAWYRFRNQFPVKLEGFVAGLMGWAKNSRHLLFSWPEFQGESR